ncbi:hypothetical protein [Streptomyces sp. CS090A]|uniref:hypothetical protein n=1 Tax=Streptomyces sp. CS090A TaxID=2162710 RepID=UPI0013A5507A|nr:hypothetical protein [Streptomyces sp. CS090A]
MFELLGLVAAEILQRSTEIEAVAQLLQSRGEADGRERRQRDVDALKASTKRLERARLADLEIDAEETRLTQRRAQLERMARRGALTQAQLDRFEAEVSAFTARLHAHLVEMTAALEEARLIRNSSS